MNKTRGVKGKEHNVLSLYKKPVQRSHLYPLNPGFSHSGEPSYSQLSTAAHTVLTGIHRFAATHRLGIGTLSSFKLGGTLGDAPRFQHLVSRHCQVVVHTILVLPNWSLLSWQGSLLRIRSALLSYDVKKQVTTERDNRARHAPLRIVKRQPALQLRMGYAAIRACTTAEKRPTLFYVR